MTDEQYDEQKKRLVTIEKYVLTRTPLIGLSDTKEYYYHMPFEEMYKLIDDYAQSLNEQACIAALESLLEIPAKFIDDGTMVYWSDFSADVLADIIKDRIAALRAKQEGGEK